MRRNAILTAAALAVLPFAPEASRAQDAMPAQALENLLATCESGCTEANEAGTCAQVCGCAAETLQGEWSQTELQTKAAALQSEDGDGPVTAELVGVVRQCAVDLNLTQLD